MYVYTHIHIHIYTRPCPFQPCLSNPNTHSARCSQNQPVQRPTPVQTRPPYTARSCPLPPATQTRTDLSYACPFSFLTQTRPSRTQTRPVALHAWSRCPTMSSDAPTISPHIYTVSEVKQNYTTHDLYSGTHNKYKKISVPELQA